MGPPDGAGVHCILWAIGRTMSQIPFWASPRNGFERRLWHLCNCFLSQGDKNSPGPTLGGTGCWDSSSSPTLHLASSEPPWEAVCSRVRIQGSLGLVGVVGLPREAVAGEGGVSGLSGDRRAEEPWPDLRIKAELCVSQRASLESTFHPVSILKGRHCLRPTHR